MVEKCKKGCLNKEKDAKTPENNNKNTEILQNKPKYNGYNPENSMIYFDYILDRWVLI